MEIKFKINQHDEHMYDMLFKLTDKWCLAASMHVDTVGDMGADNYVLKDGNTPGHYRDEITAELIF